MSFRAIGNTTAEVNVLDHSTRIIGQKVDFTRNVKVLYGFSDTSRYF